MELYKQAYQQRDEEDMRMVEMTTLFQVYDSREREFLTTLRKLIENLPVMRKADKVTRHQKPQGKGAAIEHLQKSL